MISDRDTLLLLARILQIHQERELKLEALVNSLIVFVGRLTPDAEKTQKWIEKTAAQFQQSAADIEARKQLDAFLILAESGKNPDQGDA